MILVKTGLGVRWLVWTKPFLPFLAQFGHTFWPQQAQIWDSLNRILVFNPLERHKLYYYQVCNFRTSKNLQNNCFLLFLTQNSRQKFSPNFPQMWYFLLFWPSISTQVYLKPVFLAFKCIPHAEFEKSSLIMPVSLFFYNIGPNLVQILFQRPHPLYFFWLISN